MFYLPHVASISSVLAQVDITAVNVLYLPHVASITSVLAQVDVTASECFISASRSIC